MDFSDPTSRKDRSSVVPMINIVFLLLIFFLISAAVERVAPFEIDPPESAAELPPTTPDTLFISADGTLAFGEVRGEAVYAALAEQGLAEVVIEADRALPARFLATVLAGLGAQGVTGVRLAVDRP